MTTEIKGSSLASLPNIPLLQVLFHLNFKDLVSCGLTCQRLRELSEDDFLWKRLCKNVWNLDICPEGQNWKSLFVSWYADMGRYIDVYLPIRKAWDQIEDVLQTHCKPIYDSLNEGMTEADMDEFAADYEYPLPDDMRCAYRIHNGQNWWLQGRVPGLMGSMEIHHHCRSEYLLDFSEEPLSCAELKQNLGFNFEGNCLMVTFCAESYTCQMIALTDDGGYEAGQMFYPTLNEKRELDIFITASSFLEWFTEYAKTIAEDMYLIRQEQIFRFYKEPSFVAVTDHIKCEVRTCFMPELSTVDPPKFFHTYYITLSMSPDAPRSSSVQLETRHWYICDEEGRTEEVRGPGVVGEYPVMRPGSTFSWTSCTTFRTTYGNMQGYFVMVGLETGARVEIKCPIFHMKCLPYQTYEQRKQQELIRKKDL